MTDWESLRAVESQATKVEPLDSQSKRTEPLRECPYTPMGANVWARRRKNCRKRGAILAIRSYPGAFVQLLPKQAKRRAAVVVAEAGRRIAGESQPVTLDLKS